MQGHQEQVLELLKDLLKINAIIATELIQVVENSSQQLRGEIPDACKIQHLELKRQLVQIAEKWHEECGTLRAHNLSHGA